MFGECSLIEWTRPLRNRIQCRSSDENADFSGLWEGEEKFLGKNAFSLLHLKTAWAI
jgi:hypothetical protein